MNIGELADQTGISRRAIRFYVQRGMIPPPEGKGRGSHYGPRHMEGLENIRKLQEAGHSLEAIRKILSGKEPAEIPDQSSRIRPVMKAELWTRLRVARGVELHLDTARHEATPDQLRELREAVEKILNKN
jgi:DNA-binding transcriptional MerR regulator